jgi:hypothetical protein
MRINLYDRQQELLDSKTICFRKKHISISGGRDKLYVELPPLLLVDNHDVCEHIVYLQLETNENEKEFLGGLDYKSQLYPFLPKTSFMLYGTPHIELNFDDEIMMYCTNQDPVESILRRLDEYKYS